MYEIYIYPFIPTLPERLSPKVSTFIKIRAIRLSYIVLCSISGLVGTHLSISGKHYEGTSIQIFLSITQRIFISKGYLVPGLDLGENSESEHIYKSGKRGPYFSFPSHSIQPGLASYLLNQHSRCLPTPAGSPMNTTLQWELQYYSSSYLQLSL